MRETNSVDWGKIVVILYLRVYRADSNYTFPPTSMDWVASDSPGVETTEWTLGFPHGEGT